MTPLRYTLRRAYVVLGLLACVAASPVHAQQVTINGAGLTSANVTLDYLGPSNGRDSYYYLWVTGDFSDAIEVSVDWNAATSRWEIYYGEDFPAPGGYSLLYVNTADTSPNPPSTGWQLAPSGDPAWLPAPTLSGNVTLPVELVAFTAASDGSSVRLQWTTASETGNAGFAVEHERAGAWHELAFVAGRGTTSERTDYRRVVPGLGVGTHRFRLRQIDLDGTATLSPVVEAVVGIEAPATLRALGSRVQATVRESQPVRIDLVNALGQHVAVLFEGAMDAGNAVSLDLPTGLARGVYLVRLTGHSISTSQPVVVHR